MPDKNQIKVLLVDDEPHILVALEFLVSQEGYQVFVAENGEQALRLMEAEQPRIAVLDVMMPGMDGFELARRIRQDERFDHTTIIFLTAKNTQRDRSDGYDSGAEIYIAKPFDNDHLLLAINEAVEFG
jgi:DNA-binding response OmpR family regulator